MYTAKSPAPSELMLATSTQAFVELTYLAAWLAEGIPAQAWTDPAVQAVLATAVNNRAEMAPWFPLNPNEATHAPDWYRNER